MSLIWLLRLWKPQHLRISLRIALRILRIEMVAVAILHLSRRFPVIPRPSLDLEHGAKLWVRWVHILRG